VELANTSAQAFVHHAVFDDNWGGGLSSLYLASVTGSSAHFNRFAFETSGGDLALSADNIVSNATSVWASGASAVVHFSYCSAIRNNDSFELDGTAGAGGTGPGSSVVIGPMSGTLWTPGSLQ